MQSPGIVDRNLPGEDHAPLATGMVVEVPTILLELQAAHEAAHTSAGVTDRSQQEVLRRILVRSRPGTAAFGQMFNTERTPVDSVLVSPSEVPRLLRELESRRLIAAVPCFEFQAETGWLEVHTYWVARPPQGDGLSQLFQQICSTSSRAVRDWWNSLEGVESGLLRDLEHNLAPGDTPADGHSPEAMARWSADSDYVVFFDPERALRNARLEFRPHETVLRAFAAGVRGFLAHNQDGIRIGELGFLPNQPASLLTYFETARDFLEERVVPEYLNDRRIKRKLDQFALQEALYDLEVDRPTTARFSQSRADVLIRFGFGERAERAAPGGFAPGQLAAEVVLRLGEQADLHYLERWKVRGQEFLEEFRTGLRAHGGETARMARFVQPREYIARAREIWDLLIADPRLIHATCETAKGTMHIFTTRDVGVFRHLARAYRQLTPAERWKLAALRCMLEQNREFARQLQADPDFARDYEQLLRTLHAQRLGWPARWLYLLRLRPLNEYLDRLALRRIHGEERRMSALNARLMERLRSRDKEQQRDAILTMRGPAITAEIVAELETQYFQRFRIPTVAEATVTVAQVGRDTLTALFRKAGFPVVRGDSKQSDPFESGILLFPRDSSFPGRMHQLMSITRDILSAAREHGRDGTAQSGGPARVVTQAAAGKLRAPERSQVERARRLHSYLVRQRANA